MNNKMQISQLLLMALIAIGLSAIIFISCNAAKKKKAVVSHVVHPEWSRNAIIYEVNVRQYTPQGTFSAFEEHLPRLKDLGVDILWFMPIHPIGQKNRKGELGSYYSVRDYTAVNPEFGSMDDFKRIVDQAHSLGMYVVLDWVANHTAWDHDWITSHPEWYARNEQGEMIAPFDWTDVAKLDYDKPGMRPAMTDALKFWISEADIDGYRCDVAAEVPSGFWNNVRMELDSLKPVFMLAESEEPEHHIHAFDMSYAWELHHIMNGIAKGEKKSTHLDKYFLKHDTLFPDDAYRMLFITNHDENSWNGTAFERLGEAVETFAMLTFTLPGMPMIYSGQEAGLNKRLSFFTKDTIEWGDYKYAGFYRKLADLRKENQALWSGGAGGDLKKIKTNDEAIYAFIRQVENNKVVVLVNLSDREREFTIKSKGYNILMTDYLTGEEIMLETGKSFILGKWAYRILLSSSQ
ncbi:MAG: alpha-amylase family glycosyl hydrolase [Bacteroidales bacterium]|nr:alpha-amylase family glycosyl hydrolase [Bacteroidales bacterium]